MTENLKTLEQRLDSLVQEERVRIRKARREDAIHNMQRVRTYDFKSGIAKDHRTSKTAPLKKVLK